MIGLIGENNSKTLTWYSQQLASLLHRGAGHGGSFAAAFPHRPLQRGTGTKTAIRN